MVNKSDKIYVSLTFRKRQEAYLSNPPNKLGWRVSRYSKALVVRGIIHCLLAYTYEQNGFDECKHCHIVKIGLTLIA